MFTEIKTVLRSLARSPGYTTAVTLTLALGIGTSAAFYSLFEQAIFPNRSYVKPGELVRIELVNPQQSAQPTWVFLPRLLAYKNSTLCTGMAAGFADTMNAVVKDEPEGLFVMSVTANYFSLLGVTPRVGRTFLEEEGETGSEPVVVLGHYFWRSRFQADPAVLGREIKINERIHRIIGVLPQEFMTPGSLGQYSLYIPMALPKALRPEDTYTGLQPIARLKPGATIAQLQTELAAMRPEVGQTYEKSLQPWTPLVTSIKEPPRDESSARYRVTLWTSLSALGFLYAIAVVNASGLMLVRAIGRRREIGIRLSLGGKRWQVARPFLIEGLIIGVLASAMGVVVSTWIIPTLLAWVPGSDENWAKISWMGWRAFAVFSGVSLGTGLMVSAVPAWRGSALDLNAAVKEGGASLGESRRMRKVRGGLVVIEAALAVALLAGAGLMVRTFQNLSEVRLGYDPAHRYALSVATPRSENLRAAERAEKMRLIKERLAQVPGVTAVGLAMNITPSPFYYPRKIKITGSQNAATSEEVQVVFNAVSEDFFEVLGMPMRLGRSFQGMRKSDPAVAVINETMANTYFAGKNPVGERLEISGKEKWEIIGVVADVRAARLGAKPTMYFPYWQPGGYASGVLVRTAGAPGAGFNKELRNAVYEIDPKFAVSSITLLERKILTESWNERFTMTILQVLAALALLLAMVGMFAMMAYTVSQRRSEFGVRMALGATRESICWLVLGRGLVLAAGGVLLGLGIAWGLTRFLSSLLYETKALDPLIFGGVGSLMIAIAIPACLWPAWRAAKVDLTRLLRSE